MPEACHKGHKHWCARKGFDAIEPDETEVWSNASGFDITKVQNNAYNRNGAFLPQDAFIQNG
jgi:hypothetical protein